MTRRGLWLLGSVIFLAGVVLLLRGRAPGDTAQPAKTIAQNPKPVQPAAEPRRHPDTQPQELRSAPDPVLNDDPRAISGVVRDEQGGSIADADVSAYDPDIGSRKTRTGQEGQFEIGDLDPAKTYLVSANAKGYNSATQEHVAPGTRPVSLVLVESGVLRGRVIDAVSGAPISKFSVALLPTVPGKEGEWAFMALNPVYAGVSFEDAEGQFEIEDVKAGKAVGVVARAPGFSPAHTMVPALLPGEDPPEIEFRMTPVAQITGIVVDPRNTPAAGARIFVELPEAASLEVTQSDAAGRFRINEAPTLALGLRAVHPEYDDASATVTPSAGSSVDVVLTLTEAGAIEGIIREGDTPAEGQSVAVSLVSGKSLRLKSQETRTDATGHYRFGGLPGGEYQVIAGGPNSRDEGTADRRVARASVEPGKITMVDFDFSPGTSVIEGTVTVDGLPAYEAEIRCIIGTNFGDRHISAELKQDGSFRMENLPSGAAYLEVLANYKHVSPISRQYTFAIGEGETIHRDVQINSKMGIHGRVENLGPDEHAEVMVIHGDAPVSFENIEALMALQATAAARATIDETGLYRVQGLEAGEYSVVAISFDPDDDKGDPIDSLRIAKESVTLHDGEDPEIDLAP